MCVCRLGEEYVCGCGCWVGEEYVCECPGRWVRGLCFLLR